MAVPVSYYALIWEVVFKQERKNVVEGETQEETQEDTQEFNLKRECWNNTPTPGKMNYYFFENQV
jgi:hypothetical protein